jgi:hypothetical protein
MTGIFSQFGNVALVSQSSYPRLLGRLKKPIPQPRQSVLGFINRLPVTIIIGKTPTTDSQISILRSVFHQMLTNTRGKSCQRLEFRLYPDSLPFSLFSASSFESFFFSFFIPFLSFPLQFQCFLESPVRDMLFSLLFTSRTGLVATTSHFLPPSPQIGFGHFPSLSLFLSSAV